MGPLPIVWRTLGSGTTVTDVDDDLTIKDLLNLAQ